ncbi:ribonuclease HI [Piscirickettsia salmonis]|uniref:ribonuclease HI n=1 Tax=Piscirickettsia salmonis TaxID=1238 RepID=UPI0007C9376D|nr:DNA polymerase I [Piscirickettsiaceae bacterium NZ-RLO1]
MQYDIYTDGSCQPQSGLGGWATLVLNHDQEVELSGFVTHSTNNRMEITAAIKALAYAPKTSHIRLYTDSMYLIQGAQNWLKKWRRQNWCNAFGESIANQDLWQQLDQLLHEHTHPIQWHWVKGHDGNLYNERCDRMAAAAITSRHSYKEHKLKRKHKQSPLLLVDGSSFIYRAFHGIPARHNHAGEPTAAIYGTISLLRKLLKTYKPKHMLVVLDPAGKTLRHHIYPAYKSSRPPMPEELKIQIPLIRECIDALGIPRLSIPGIEADDIIGTLATQAHQAKQATLIASSDKDMAQLITPYISLLDTMKGTLTTPECVEKRFGLRPEQIPDYLALIGDKVDDVPGIDKVGPKTAQRWLAQYHNLESIIQQADQIKGKVGENLRSSIKQLKLSQRLVTIYRDLELPYTLNDLKRKSINIHQLATLFERFEFNTWLERLQHHNS